MSEQAVLFDSDGYSLTGILHSPQRSTDLGVLLVVGGPQYRVGSHRQFVLLSRAVAEAGWPVFRFDYRGMGDSSGANIDFEACGDDIRAAIDQFAALRPELRRVVIWGLCDAASAACMYAPGDERVAGLVLLNPWVRTPEGEAKTMLRHYYLKRLTSPDFWKKLLRGGVSVGGAVSGISDQVKSASSTGDAGPTAPLPERMKRGLGAFGGERLVILSGKDLVADEFRDRVRSDADWARLMGSDLTHVQELADANHTFAEVRWRDQVAAWTVEWLRSRFS